MADNAATPLVTVEWLRRELLSENLCVVDGSWHLPAFERDPKKEYEKSHIPGAVFFDVDDISDNTTKLPHMVPTEKQFSSQVESLGISSDEHVIVYDTTGIGSAARVWWMFRLFGHDNVSVLDGGFPAWTNAQGPCEGEVPLSKKSSFTAKFNKNLLRTIEDIQRNLETGKEQIIDARSEGRFKGVEPEPRVGLAKGHIPQSINLPFLQLYDPRTKLMKSKNTLLNLFDSAKLSEKSGLVASCGSGITACNIALALYMIGRKNCAIYDGSWAEWGGRHDTPIATD